MKIEVRDAPPRAVWALEQAGVHPLMARLYAARGVHSADSLDEALAHLLRPDTLKGAHEAAALLADAIAQDAPMCIVADYDCDGATACAVGIRGLRAMGAQQVSYLVPNRVDDGYGLSPALAERAAASGARVLITVDNGIASIAGVARARELGLRVIVTDHHLPGAQLPNAHAIVNPNQPGCPFASKALAGVGVMFYVLLALRAELRARGQAEQPKLDTLLPLVALGTVADVVPLDDNNRRLVAQGLRRVRAGHMPAGMAALFAAAGRKAPQASCFDFGFALGPRINAAGRLADMTLGIELLMSDDAARCADLAAQLDAINRQRRSIEDDMRAQALTQIDELIAPDAAPPAAIAVYHPEFHEGVVGIVASRLKERLHRPTFVFAPSGAADGAGALKGSGRSIAGFHLRDALCLVAERCPGALLKFGGHAMAAGCTLAAGRFDDFAAAFQAVAAEQLDAATLEQRLQTDGALPAEYLRADIADMLQAAVWGQGFPAPLFSQEVDVLSQRPVGDGKHLSLRLRCGGQDVGGIWFGRSEPLPPRALLAFRLEADEWQGERRVRLMVQGMQE
ncbi:MAG: single-stranded-DNA-specific exonuclease RecJ [Ottowia sp.]|nr:single-stranded-DNA-specific exonuclease RecJ [Ottowia sp.]